MMSAFTKDVDASEVLADVHRRVTCNPEDVPVVIEDRGIIVHCVNHNGTLPSPSELRGQLLGKDGDGKNTFRIVQVVGDSGSAFSDDGAAQASEMVKEHWTDSTFLEYGYTAQLEDTNWSVAQVLQERPELGFRCIANVVDASVGALAKTWLGSPHVRHFVLLYSSKDQIATNFGDDMFLSDGMMLTDSADMIICLEGGLQTLRQCVNVLTHNIPVTALTDLRQAEPERFSAARLLLELRDSGRLSDKEAEKYGAYPTWPAIQHELKRLEAANVAVSSLIRNARSILS